MDVYLKNWRETHPNYQKEWYTKNKDEFLAKLRVPVTCDCGFTCGKNNLKRHQKSNTHLKRLPKL
jgi:hypothetical protein